MELILIKSKYVYFYNNNKELIRIDNNLESKMENYYELNESMKEIYEKTYKEYKLKNWRMII